MPSVTITNSAAELLPQNELRQALIIQNEDSSIVVYIKLEDQPNTTVSSTNHDHRLQPGASISFDEDVDGPVPTRKRITVIAASGTPRLSYYESESVER